jgi:hypothetical protein
VDALLRRDVPTGTVVDDVVTKPTAAQISEIAPSRNPSRLSSPEWMRRYRIARSARKVIESRKMRIGLLMLGDAPVRVMLERARLAEAVGYDRCRWLMSGSTARSTPV